MTEISHMIRIYLSVIALCGLTVGPAAAASSSWTEAPGGRVRLVTSGPVSASGELRGALQIELQPGWKTYWRDPGSSGVPPVIDVSASGDWAGAELEFPAPQRHNDDSGAWAGYDYPVALPVTLRAAPGKSPSAVTGSVFLGICETICVPVQATIDLTIDSASTAQEESALVDAAWQSLPAAASREAGGVTSTKTEGDVLVLRVQAPTPITDLFVAGEDGYQFGQMTRMGGETFTFHILTRPKMRRPGPGLHYTLATATGATVSGLIPYP